MDGTDGEDAGGEETIRQEQEQERLRRARLLSRDLVRRAEAMSLAGDAEALTAFLAGLDATESLSSSGVRFVTAVRAMQRGQFHCAAAAWCDAAGPGCWVRTNDEPDSVPSGAAAEAMVATCAEVIRLRERVAELEAAALGPSSSGWRPADFALRID